MRVVAAVPLYPPDSRVGAWLATHEWLAHLAKRGHEVHVTRAFAGGDAYRLDGVHVRDCPVEEAVAAADVVVSHASDEGEAHRAAVARGVPSVRLWHSAAPADRGNGAALAVLNSQATAAEVGPLSCPSIVCHPHTNPDAHRVDRTGKRITLVNLSPAKGVETFRLLSAACYDLPFLAVRGGYGSQQRVQAPNVLHLPMQHDMRRVWERTRILAMPSLRESWGMVAIEAACSGIPTVAHPCAGLVEALGDAAVWVDRSDIRGWRSAIADLRDPGRYAELSARARARAAELAAADDLDRFADAVEALCP